MTVFGDAFYWVALLNRRDAYHDRVKRHAIAYRGSILTGMSHRSLKLVAADWG